jgi:hypothetical protein
VSGAGDNILNQKQFTRWIRQIHATNGAEIECDRLQKLLPAVIDAEMSGFSHPCLVDVKTHLLQCADCADDYNGLLHIARLEAGNQLPTAAELLATLTTSAAPASSSTVDEVPVP